MNTYNPEEMIEIKQSLVCDGRGVFAKVDIPSGTLITKYGCVEYDEKEKIRDYDLCIKTKDGYVVFQGDKNPSIDRCGSLLNDCCTVLDPSLRGISEYRDVVREKVNCDFTILDDFDNRPYVYSVRDIKAGEELYCSYGFGYWLGKLGIENKIINDLKTKALPLYTELLDKFQHKIPIYKIRKLYLRKYKNLNIDFPIE